MLICCPHSHQPQRGSNPGAHQQMNGYAKCGIYKQWNIIQPWKGKKFWHATTWLKLENIILTEISKRTSTVWFHLYEVPRMVIFMEIESRMLVARVESDEDGGEESCLIGVDFQFCKMKKVLEIGCTTVWMYLTLLNHILQKWWRW